MTIQIGLMLEGQFGLTWARWQRLLRAAEEMGYEFLFRSDHFTIGPPDLESLETWVSLTYAADHTKRIEFGPLVSPTTFRHPSLTVRMAAAVDDLSNGRLVLGLGAGWHEREHRQFGIPFYDKKMRLEMLEDALEITTRLLREDTPVTFSGKHFSLQEAVLLPRPQRRGGPPILIGGIGRTRTIPLAARYADEWNAPFVTPETFKELNTLLSAQLEQVGRQPSSVRRSLMTEVIFAEDDAAMRAKLSARPELSSKLSDRSRIGGTPTQIVDQIGAYIEAGVQRFMLQWLDLDDIAGLEKIAKSVIPQVHKQ